MSGFTSILYATDLSEASDLACTRAVELARRCGAKLTILHAYAYPTTVAADPTTVAEDCSTIDPRPELENTLGLVASDVHDLPIHRVLCVGTPAETIVEYARRHNSELIVMGMHGRTGFARLLMGSVVEKVLRLAPCPVMVVRQQTVMSAEPRICTPERGTDSPAAILGSPCPRSTAQ